MLNGHINMVGSREIGTFVHKDSKGQAVWLAKILQSKNDLCGRLLTVFTRPIIIDSLPCLLRAL